MEKNSLPVNCLPFLDSANEIKDGRFLVRWDRRPFHDVSLRAEVARPCDVGLGRKAIAGKHCVTRTSIMDEAFRARTALRGETAGKDGKAP